MDYSEEILIELKEINKTLKSQTLILNNIEKIFSKYDQEYLEETQGENFPQG